MGKKLQINLCRINKILDPSGVKVWVRPLYKEPRFTEAVFEGREDGEYIISYSHMTNYRNQNFNYHMLPVCVCMCACILTYTHILIKQISVIFFPVLKL